MNPNFQKSNKNNNRVITKNLNYCQNWNWFYLYAKQFKIFLLMDEILLLKNKFFATKTIEWFESIKALVSVVFLTNNLITKNQQKIKKRANRLNIILFSYEWVSRLESTQRITCTERALFGNYHFLGYCVFWGLLHSHINKDIIQSNECNAFALRNQLFITAKKTFQYLMVWSELSSFGKIQIQIDVPLTQLVYKAIPFGLAKLVFRE